VADTPRAIGSETLLYVGLTNSGLVGGALVDTGPDADEYRSHAVKHVLITHGHADHFSAAADLRRGGARVVAPREEASLVENPEVNIRGMFSWARPSDEMVTKMFRGEGVPVDEYSDEWHGYGIETIPLPGHTLGHSGYLTSDGALFTGDALYVRELWDRHPLPYAIDPGLVRASLHVIDSLDFEWLVPGHGPAPIARKDVSAEVAHHLARMDAVSGWLLAFLREPRTTEQAIAAVSEHVGLVENPAQYWLAVTTVKGYLSDLLRLGSIEFAVRDHAGTWGAV
jgi:glyoxylase-like metal-dependent hydrolase (beta-lactamase superfamily II)